MFKYNQINLGDVLVLDLDGRLDAITAPTLRSTLDTIVSEHIVKVVVDMQDVDLIDSSGVGVIIALYKRLRSTGGDVKIGSLVGQPREIFRLLRLQRAFDVYDSVDEAVKSFAK